MRDIGPYESIEQARAQIAATTHGIPATDSARGFIGELVLMEALLLAGVQISAWEDVVRQEVVAALSPEAAQVIAGWLIRARLAAADAATTRTA